MVPAATIATEMLPRARIALLGANAASTLSDPSVAMGALAPRQSNAQHFRDRHLHLGVRLAVAHYHRLTSSHPGSSWHWDTYLPIQGRIPMLRRASRRALASSLITGAMHGASGRRRYCLLIAPASCRPCCDRIHSFSFGLMPAVYRHSELARTSSDTQREHGTLRRCVRTLSSCRIGPINQLLRPMSPQVTANPDSYCSIAAAPRAYYAKREWASPCC